MVHSKDNGKELASELTFKLSINGVTLGTSEEEVLMALIGINPRAGQQLDLSLSVTSGTPPFIVKWLPEAKNVPAKEEKLSNFKNCSTFSLISPTEGLFSMVISVTDSQNRSVNYLLGLPILPSLKTLKSKTLAPLSRRLTRRKTFEILFEYELNPTQNIEKLIADRILIPEDSEELLNNFEDGLFAGELKPENLEFVYTVVKSVIKYRDLLDSFLRKYPIQWEFSRIGLIEKILMRIALVEMILLNHPFKIVVNEVVQLAKVYCRKESGKFINGILGNVYKDIDLIKREFNNEKN